jgi:hypothetical protein
MRHVVFVWAYIIYIHVGRHGDAPRGICLGRYYIFTLESTVMRHVVFVWAYIIYIHAGRHGDAPRGICLGRYYIYSRWRAR